MNVANLTFVRTQTSGSKKLHVDMETSRRRAEEPNEVVPGQVIGAGSVLKESLLQSAMLNVSSDSTTRHAHYGDAIVAVYIGSGVNKVDFANWILEDFITTVQNYGIGKTMQTQHCRVNDTSSSVFGIIADTSSGREAFSTVRQAVKAWSKGECAKSFQLSASSQHIATPSQMRSSTHGKSLTITNQTSKWIRVASKESNQTGLIPSLDLLESNQRTMFAPNECSVIEVVPADSCAKLVDRCAAKGHHLTGNELERWNRPGLCSGLVGGQRVCCSAGGLPDIRPQKRSDGGCAVYNVQPGDFCNKIAVKHDIRLQELETFNKNTWGFNCDKLFKDAKICVSDGEPPFPAASTAAICGPTKLGTQKPPGSKSTDWALLNPCPLKACCNIWGKCGTTEQFCISQSTGPPGTSSGQNGCVANCGTLITNNKKAPKQFLNIGYFESWNRNRKCLNMDIQDIPNNKYTYIHYAFADITPDYQVSVDRFKDQWEKFRRAKGYKRILAFGGWEFSTSASTAAIFREGVRSGRRERLASNVVDFILKNDLDGVDFDWEYPSVPDMDWLPRSSPDEGPNYAEFLRLVRSKLPQKSISIAAPASFWYLKGMPIEEIGRIVDYIVYMPYDLYVSQLISYLR
jgi:hypothetical protein